MRPDDEYTWEADMWDEYLNDFGVEAYIQARYVEQANPIMYSHTEACPRCGEVHPV